MLVRFPFTDQRGGKQRPAVVISSAAYNQARLDIILMAVTSQIRAKVGFGEVAIQDWQSAGLLKPSAIKPSDPRRGKNTRYTLVDTGLCQVDH